MKAQKESLLALLVLAAASALAGCSAASEGDDASATEVPELRQIPPTGLSLDALKARVTQIASANTTKTDAASLADTRRALNPFVADLARIYKTPAVSVELDNGFASTWKQLFSDDVRPAPPGAPTQDPASIHQVVTAKGYFYNLSNQIVPTPPGAPVVVVSAFLRGTYATSPVANELDITFTRFGILPSVLPASQAIGALAESIERGEVGAPGAGGPPAGPPAAASPSSSSAGGPPAGAPRGPVGVKGKLRNLYLDGDLRIALGGTADQQFNKIYVLQRVNP